MSDSRNFWLQLHAIANELQDEGESDYERAMGLSDWLGQMPDQTRVDCLADLESVSAALAELNAHLVRAPAVPTAGGHAVYRQPV